MARANRELISALRQTAQRLAGDVSYQWGHMGMCNCGHLAQWITGLAGAEIHQSALIREGDWEQQAKDYCPTSGQLIDVVLATMFDLGLTRNDVRNLEKLSDLEVLRRAGIVSHEPVRDAKPDVLSRDGHVSSISENAVLR